MLKRDTQPGRGPLEVQESYAPIAPLGNQINYSEMVLTQVRSAPTNMGWKSVFVTVILALACAGATSLFYMLRVPSADKFVAALVRSHMQEGSRLYDAGQYDEAILEYNEAIIGRSDYDLAYFRRGEAYEAKGDTAQAIADYRKVLEVSPDQAMKQAVADKLRKLGVTSP
jgi:tetratricopeptide (TPR) repeat protein